MARFWRSMAMLDSFASYRQPDETSVSSDRLSVERAVIVTVALGTVLAPLNSTMIIVALPHVMEEFSADVTSAGWLVTAYLIAMASLQPVAGKLGDRFGRRRLILGGLAYFGLASLGAAIAPSLPVLLFFRVQQAIAGAIALPNGVALVREVVPINRRASRFGLIGAATALAAATGPPLSGLLIGIAGWRIIFYVNLLFILPTLILGWRSIPVRPARGSDHPFDLAGAILLSVVLIGTAGLLMWGTKSKVALMPVFAIVLVGVAAFFLWREFHHPDPVLQPRFFGYRAFAAANGAIALSNLAMYSTLLAIPILLSRQGGWKSTEIGLVLTAMSAAMIIFSPIGGRLADHFGRRWLTVTGLLLLTLGLLPLALTGGRITLLALLGGLGLAGVGLGLSSAGLQTVAVESVGLQEAGVASGVFSTSRYLGSIVGSSVLAGLLSPARDSISGFETLFMMVVVGAFLSAL
ncbi:MAG: MFS transporter, partial [Candidatus Tectomicrobia bacterium]|nr:MFS transporter [Candidatus Tectomicrobia bacterium]